MKLGQLKQHPDELFRLTAPLRDQSAGGDVEECKVVVRCGAQSFRQHCLAAAGHAVQEHS